MQLSLRTIGYLIVLFAGYFGLFGASMEWEGSFAQWAIQSMGFFCSTFLYFSGAFAFFFACRFARRGRTASQIASAIPLTLVPALIGAIAAIRGYITIYRLMDVPGISPYHSIILSEHVAAFVCLLFGLSITVLCFTILSIALIVNTHAQWKREPSDQPQQADNA